jgi:magnesium transporter
MLIESQDTSIVEQKIDIKTLKMNILNALSKSNKEEIIELFVNVSPDSIALLFLDISQDDINQIIEILNESFNMDTLMYLPSEYKESIIKQIGYGKSANMFLNLSIDDIIEILSHVSEEIKDSVIEHIPDVIRDDVKKGFGYPDKSVGSIMEEKFISFKNTWSVGECLDFVRQNSKTDESFYAAIIVTEENMPVGHVLFSSLIQKSRHASITEIMSKESRISDVYTNVEEIAFYFKQYGLTIIPVVNKIGKLVGTVSLNNAIAIIEEKAEEDILHLSGLSRKEENLSIFETAKERLPWLCINLTIAFVISRIIDFFSVEIEKLVVLAAIMPIVPSMGGNAGTQTVTIAVRAIASNEFTTDNAFRVIMRHTCICFMNGTMIGTIGALVVYLLYHDLAVSAVFLTAAMINFFIAGFFGSLIPYVLESLKIDPALASSIFLTACTDSVGFFSFLMIAKVFLL